MRGLKKRSLRKRKMRRRKMSTKFWGTAVSIVTEICLHHILRCLKAKIVSEYSELF